MKIGIDIMGGDFAPEQPILGAIESLSEINSDTSILLIGDKNKAEKYIHEALKNNSRLSLFHTTEVIEYNDHPVKAFKGKTDSSIRKGFELLATKNIDVFASAGNTGAMLVGATQVCGMINGISRPVIGTEIPLSNNESTFILDVGINADCKPELLKDFAIIGSSYMKSISKKNRPSVALLNLGEEPEKGSILTKEAYKLLKNTPEINFIGNIEGRDLYSGKADVIVCDGFTGNVILKQAESFYDLVKSQGFDNNYFERFNYENYGGTPVLGINQNVIIGHGVSNSKAIKNMVLAAEKVVLSNLTKNIKASFNTVIS